MRLIAARMDDVGAAGLMKKKYETGEKLGRRERCEFRRRSNRHSGQKQIGRRPVYHLSDMSNQFKH